MKVSDEEKKQFRDAVGAVKKIKNSSSKDSSKPKPSPHVRENNIDISYKINKTAVYEKKVDGNTKLKFCRAGKNNKEFKKLCQGKIRYEDELYLRGCTITETLKKLKKKMISWQLDGIYCVKITHGKGLGSKEKFPVIKNKLNEFLREHPMVWGFCSAQQKHGGTGAIYVLFKKQ
jgi:DNA-nicking Smr family endonuclease